MWQVHPTCVTWRRSWKTEIRPESGTYPANLTLEALGKLLFDILQVPIKDCLAFDYNTGRYDIKQVNMKLWLPVREIIAQSPVTFNDHTVTGSQQRLNITRVTFNLCFSYGKPVDNTVLYLIQRSRVISGTLGLLTWSCRKA